VTDGPPAAPRPSPGPAVDAVVTPVEPEGDGDDPTEQVTPVVISDAAEAQALGASRTPHLQPYDPAPQREKMRNWIGKGVLMSTALAGLGVIINGVAGGDNEQAVTAVFTGLIGVAGTIVGFYFGGKDKTG
jgi:hypothetical protein